MDPSDIDQLLLVGGTSKVPAVRQFVGELLDMAPATGVDPMTAVGEGAAVAAAIMSGELVDNDFFLSTEHAMGTIVADPTTQTLRFSPIILKNQKLPAKESDTFVPVIDFQESVKVTVLEGDPNLPIGHPDNLILATIDVRLDPPRLADDVTIELTYLYDSDGLLHVDVTDGKTGDKLVETLELSGTGAVGGRALVDIATRVRATVEDGVAVGKSVVPESLLDPESASLVATAKSKVIPFVDDDDAAVIKALVAALEEADETDRSGAYESLQTALRPFSYLL